MGEEIARCRVRLQDASPAVWREVELPLSATLGDLHCAIQAAMCWEDFHLYQFATPAGSIDRDSPP
jgi:hypothetical protein